MRAPVEAPNMLWLIQRDFLEGKTVQQMVSEALSEVPNPTRNGDIAQVLSLLQSSNVVSHSSPCRETFWKHPACDQCQHPTSEMAYLCNGHDKALRRDVAVSGIVVCPLPRQGNVSRATHCLDHWADGSSCVMR